MGLVDKLVMGVGAAAIAAIVAKITKDAQETKRRRQSPLFFDEGITEREFSEIATDAAKRARRITEVAVSGMTVTLQVRSNSGLSTWGAEVDFNDYGHLTGRYWIYSQNSDSIIPAHFADGVKAQLDRRLSEVTRM